MSNVRVILSRRPPRLRGPNANCSHPARLIFKRRRKRRASAYPICESRWVATSPYPPPPPFSWYRNRGGVEERAWKERQIGSYIERIDNGLVLCASAHYLIRYPEEKELDRIDFEFCGELIPRFNWDVKIFVVNCRVEFVSSRILERFSLENLSVLETCMLENKFLFHKNEIRRNFYVIHHVLLKLSSLSCTENLLFLKSF